MAVLVEAISVVVRRDAIDTRFSGGWRQFVSIVPNATLCTDDDLARVGFMSPSDVQTFVRRLEKSGLTCIDRGKFVDIAIVDQLHGPTMPVDWLEIAHLKIGDSGNKVAACWLFEGPRIAAGIHMPETRITIATPPGWRYAGSLSANFKFVAKEEISDKMKFLRHEGSTDIYLDLSTGKEVYVARAKKPQMSLLDKCKRLLGIRPVNVGELNRRATREVEKPKQKTNDKTQPDEIVITKEYEKIREKLEEGFPVIFVTGKAGTGKSTLISYLRSVLDKRLVVVAPTGVAALNAGGVTINSFCQFPPRILEETDIRLVYDRKLYQKLELLIIDEVSMVRCDLLDGIDRFLRMNRENNKPFGGVQLLLIGDLFQLPPVVNEQEWDVLRARGYASPYFFSSFCLQETSFLPIELTTVYKQKDQSFVDLLNRIRIGEDLDFVINEVNRKCFLQDDFQTDIT